MQSTNIIPKCIYKNFGRIFLIIKVKPGSKKEGIISNYLLFIQKN